MTKKTLETGQDKIQKICDVLRRETLEPAEAEAQKIIEEAKKRAEQILLEAKKQIEKQQVDAKKSIEQERNVFQSSLAQAAKQSTEALRQAIEHKLFNPELHNLVGKQSSEPQVIANLITILVKAIEKEGLEADISAYIPSAVSPKEVNQYLAENILNKLKNQSVTIGDFGGGAKLRLEGKRLMLDISDAEIEELLRKFLRKDFRKLIFAE
jgi:V/A-type H+/Na+-transporting ATPase subunit E